MSAQDVPPLPPDDDTEAPLPLPPSTFLNLLADLKLADALAVPPQSNLSKEWKGERIPQELVDGAQQALVDLKLPTGYVPGKMAGFSIADVTSSKYPDINPERVQFNIPGYEGKWALSVDRRYIGNGYPTAEGWANVAKRLGQRGPSATPPAPQ